MAKSVPFAPGHHDRVTVLHTNFHGTRILTASIDHRIKVWNRDPKTGALTLLDTFTAHDADIRDAKFLHPTLGSHLASIGNDLKFHLWSEDFAQQPQSGHRFRRVCTIPSTPRVPFVSMDLKTLPLPVDSGGGGGGDGGDDVVPTTLLALIDRQGLLSVYEPTDPDDLREWTLIDAFNVCGANNAPGRGDETSFKVRFDQSTSPLAYVASLSDDRAQVGLVVAALNEVKIYRSVIPPSASSGPGGSGAEIAVTGGIGAGVPGGGGLSRDGASRRLMFYEAVRLPTHPALVRDVAWAPFSVRGTDRIATACKDGAVRIFELSVAEAPAAANAPGGRHPSAPSTAPGKPTNAQQQRQQQQQQSSLTSAITGRQSHSAQPGNSVTAGAVSSQTSASTRAGYTFPYLTATSSITNLPHAHSDAWSLSFDAQGQVLMSTGSDGVTKLWRKSVLGGQWLVFAGQEIGDGDGDTDSDDEDASDGAEDGGKDDQREAAGS